REIIPVSSPSPALTPTNAAQAAGELTGIISRAAAAYPHRSGVTVFVAGAAPVGFLVGRAINLHVVGDVWVTEPAQSRGLEGRAEAKYELALSLPFREAAARPISSGPQDQLARRKALETIIEGIEEAKKLMMPEDLPWSFPEARRGPFVDH